MWVHVRWKDLIICKREKEDVESDNEPFGFPTVCVT